MSSAIETLTKEIKDLETATATCCKSCNQFQVRTAQILKQLMFYIALSEPALDEQRTDHHDVSAYMMAEMTDMAGQHTRFKKGGQTDLPASIQRLMRSNTSARKDNV